jgi:hypothetical protein
VGITIMFRLSIVALVGVALCTRSAEATNGPSIRPTPKNTPDRKPKRNQEASLKHQYVAYWLTLHPPNPKSTIYEPVLLLARLPIGQLAALSKDLGGIANRKDPAPLLDALALTFETYKKDSIWNPDGRPFKVLQAIDMLDLERREVTINGDKYRYEPASIQEVLLLLEHPEGTVPLHRLHGPLTGFTQTARALGLLLKEQLASDGGGKPAQKKTDALDGKQFQSVDKHERGRAEKGVALGYWHLRFRGGLFTWNFSDVSQSGRYDYDAATGKITGVPQLGKRNYQGTYDPKTGALIWEDKKYKEVPQEKKEADKKTSSSSPKYTPSSTASALPENSVALPAVLRLPRCNAVAWAKTWSSP